MKADIPFQLKTAVWPAFLVTGTGEIDDANDSPQSIFGDLLARGRLTALGEGEVASDGFLELCGPPAKPIVALKFRNRDNAVSQFSTAISPIHHGPQTFYLFQLLPLNAGNGPGTPAKKGTEVASANGVNRQKLDCALHLTRTVALDFNNALTTVLGHVSYLLNQAESEHPWRFSLLEVEKAAGKAAAIAQDLAAFSLDERESPAREGCSLNRVVRQAVQHFSNSANAGIAWAQECENRMFAVRGNESKLEQALIKVLENSVESLNRDGQIRGQITIRTRNVDLPEAGQDANARLAAGIYACMEIIDDGCGVSPEDLQRVFEPFFTTKSGHRGLGLAWVYGIISNEGGAVAFTSQPRQGTSVRIYLPATGRIVEEPLHLPEAPTQGTGTILFVDDEEMVVNLGEMLLSSVGYRVITATSGEQALETFQRAESPIHLLITDMVMPRMNGRQLIEKVRTLSPSTRIICSTACVRTVRSANDLNYLSKPFTSQELLRRVKEALDGAQAA